jgi:hypothetical protein
VWVSTRDDGVVWLRFGEQITRQIHVF